MCVECAKIKNDLFCVITYFHKDTWLYSKIRIRYNLDWILFFSRKTCPHHYFSHNRLTYQTPEQPSYQSLYFDICLRRPRVEQVLGQMG